VVWSEGVRLVALRAGERREAALPAPLVGRPIQRADGGLTVITGAAGRALAAAHLDARLGPLRVVPLVPWAHAEGALATGADPSGGVHLAACVDGVIRLAVLRGEAVSEREVFPLAALLDGAPGRVELLALRLELKRCPRPALLVAALAVPAVGAPSLVFRAVALDDRADPTPPLRVTAGAWLDPGERVVAAEWTRGPAGAVVVLATSAGRLLAIEPGAPPRRIPGVDPRRAAQARLFASGDGAHLFHPAPRVGLGHALLAPNAQR
jgi:hypothetical protein